MIEQPELGRKIRQARKNQKLTLMQLGAKVGIRHQSLINIENGRNNPRKPTLDSICRELMIDPNTLEPFQSAFDELGVTMNKEQRLTPEYIFRMWIAKYESDLKRIPKR